MVDVKEIANVMLQKKCDGDFYLDLELNEVIFVKNYLYECLNSDRMINLSDAKDKEILLRLNESVINGTFNRFLPIPNLNSNALYYVNIDYCEKIKVNDDVKTKLILALDNCNEEEFLEILKENNFINDYNHTKESFAIDMANEWAQSQGITEIEISLKDIIDLFSLVKEMYKASLWNYFSNNDLITVKKNGEEYSFSILGSDQKKFGVCIYFDQVGKYGRYLEYSKKLDRFPYLLESLQDSIVIRFDSKENLQTSDLKLIEESKLSFDENGYPFIRHYVFGQYPKNKMSMMLTEEVTMALASLMKGINIFATSTREIDFNEEELYINLDTKRVSKRNLRKANSCPIQFVYTSLSKKDINIIEDKAIEINIDCLSKPVEGDYFINLYWIYCLIIINDDSKLIEQSLVETSEKSHALEKMQTMIIEEFINKGIPKYIYCTNEIVYSMFKFLEKYGIIVTNDGYISEEMATVYAEFNKMRKDTYLN